MVKFYVFLFCFCPKAPLTILFFVAFGLETFWWTDTWEVHKHKVRMSTIHLCISGMSQWGRDEQWCNDEKCGGGVFTNLHDDDESLAGKTFAPLLSSSMRTWYKCVIIANGIYPECYCTFHQCLAESLFPHEGEFRGSEEKLKLMHFWTFYSALAWHKKENANC